MYIGLCESTLQASSSKRTRRRRIYLRFCHSTDHFRAKISSSSSKLLTKGDNNVADDTELYAKGQSYLDRKADIIGSVRGYVPAVGYVTIMLSEHPWLKTVMLGLMGVMVILQRE